MAMSSIGKCHASTNLGLTIMMIKTNSNGLDIKTGMADFSICVNKWGCETN